MLGRKLTIRELTKIDRIELSQVADYIVESTMAEEDIVHCYIDEVDNALSLLNDKRYMLPTLLKIMMVQDFTKDDVRVVKLSERLQKHFDDMTVEENINMMKTDPYTIIECLLDTLEYS